MGILPFQCRKCNVDFQPHEGGRCEVCGGWFCRRHLRKQKNGKTYRCGQCGKQPGRVVADPAQALLRLRAVMRRRK